MQSPLWHLQDFKPGQSQGKKLESFVVGRGGAEYHASLQLLLTSLGLLPGNGNVRQRQMRYSPCSQDWQSTGTPFTVLFSRPCWKQILMDMGVFGMTVMSGVREAGWVTFS